jgi:hypothetical protein
VRSAEFETDRDLSPVAVSLRAVENSRGLGWVDGTGAVAGGGILWNRVGLSVYMCGEPSCSRGVEGHGKASSFAKANSRVFFHGNSARERHA